MQMNIKNLFNAVAATFSLFIVPGGSINPALAQSCTTTIDNLDFGTVDLSSGASFTTSGSVVTNCTGTPGLKVRMCINIGSGTGNIDPSGDPRYQLNGANQLDFNLYKNGALTNIWGSWVWGLPPTGKTYKVRIKNSGTGTKSRAIRAQIKAGQAGTPPGLYVSSFAGGHTLISYAYESVGSCNVISGLGGDQAPFTTMATVDGACTLSATDLNFGNVGVLNSNVDSTNNISVQCSSGIPYTIGLSNGSSGGTGPTNRLMSAGPSTVTYGIYSNAGRSTPWGDLIGTNTVAGVGSGTSQNFTGYGRVPMQTTPAPGTYTDTITVTVTY